MEQIGLLQQLFAAQKTQSIGEHQEQTGIWKTPVAQVEVNTLGIVGDIQVDKRFHGGVEKALHQYAVTSYELLRQQFPHLSAQLVVGSIGENLSATEMSEHTVHIGDVFQIGSVTIQVSEPRSPCWKINAKFDEPKLAKFIAEQAISGWYYRVLKSGTMQVGDAIYLVERPNALSLHEFVSTYSEHRPDLEAVEGLATCVGLSQGWRNKVQQRLKFLRQLNLPL